MTTLERSNPVSSENAFAARGPTGANPIDSAVSRPEPIAINEEQDMVFAKLQSLKEQHFQLLREFYMNLTAKCQQALPSEQLAKLKLLKDHVYRVLPYLNLTKEKMPKDLNHVRVEALEQHIIKLADSFKRSRLSQQQALQDQQKQQQQQQEQLLKVGDPVTLQQQHLRHQQLQQQVDQQQQQQQHLQQQQQWQQQKQPPNQQQSLLQHQQPQNALSIEAASSQPQPQGSLLMQKQPVLQDQSLQVDAGGLGDHTAVSRPEPIAINEEQDMVFAKLQSLKEQHFQLLREFYMKLTAKCQQALPSEQLAKLKLLKDHVYRVLPYLNLTKEKMPKDLNHVRVEALEQHIIKLADSFKRSRLSQQQALQDQQ